MSTRRVSSGSPFEASIGFSRAVRVGRQVHVAGTAPIHADGTCPEGSGAQAMLCLEIILLALSELGARPEDVVRTRIFLTDAADAVDVAEAHATVFGRVRPTTTMVVVAALLDERWKVEIEAEAIVAE